MFMKLSRDEMLIALHMDKGVSAISAQGQIQGEAKIGHWWVGGSPSSKNFFTPEGYNNKLNS